MENSVVDKIKELVESGTFKVTDIATATDIPKDRIYKWVKGIGAPKAKDQQTLSDWLNGTLSKVKNPFPDNKLDEERALLRVLVSEIAEMRVELNKLLKIDGGNADKIKDEYVRRAKAVLDALRTLQ